MAATTKVKSNRWSSSGVFLGPGVLGEQTISLVTPNLVPKGKMIVIEQAFVCMPAGAKKFGLNFADGTFKLYFKPRLTWARNISTSARVSSVLASNNESGIRVIGKDDEWPWQLDMIAEILDETELSYYFSGRFDMRVPQLFDDSIMAHDSKRAICGNSFVACAKDVNASSPAAHIIKVPRGWMPVIDEVLPFSLSMPMTDANGDSVPIEPIMKINQIDGASIVSMMHCRASGIAMDGLIFGADGPFGVIRNAPYQEADDVMIEFVGLGDDEHFDITVLGHFETV